MRKLGVLGAGTKKPVAIVTDWGAQHGLISLSGDCMDRNGPVE